MKWLNGRVSAATLALVLVSYSTGGQVAKAQTGNAPASAESGQMTREQAMKILDDQMQKMDGAIRQGMHQAAEKYKTASIPEPPPKDKVVADKDRASMNMYGGLCEKMLFQDDVAKAEDLRQWIVANAGTVCGEGDPSPGLINGDFALYYYDKGDFAKAEPLCMSSIQALEPAVAANKVSFLSLISTYACKAEICWKTDRKEEARQYIVKIIKLQQEHQAEAPGGSSSGVAETPKEAPESTKEGAPTAESNR